MSMESLDKLEAELEEENPTSEPEKLVAMICGRCRHLRVQVETTFSNEDRVVHKCYALPMVHDRHPEDPACVYFDLKAPQLAARKPN